MDNKGNKSSTFILLLLYVILASIALIRLITLYSSESTEYTDPVVSTKNVRGTIYDRHGSLLAFDTTRTGFLLLSEDKNQEAATLVARFSSDDAVTITSAIEDGVTFFPIDESGVDEASEALLASSLTSVLTLTTRDVRVSPYSSMDKIIGREGKREGGGIESMFNSYLSAVPTLNAAAVYGEDIVLTIDINYEEILSSVLSALQYEGRGALLNGRGEIIAWYGDVTDELIKNITYSHSTREETVLFIREDYIPLDECTELSSLYLYLSYPDETVVSRLKAELGL